REEMAAIAVRALKQLKAVSTLSSSQTDSILNTFADAKDVSAWAKGELATAINNKIIQGVGQNELATKALATRAQAAVIVYNVLNQSSGF
ncbi:S-layer homology domain-containing protein, partial [Klebsiella pneumoniae]